MSDNADQIAYWNDTAGARWASNQVRLDRMMAPLTDALVAGAGLRPGETVLDIGCGCGDLALRLSEAVGPSGRVLAVDVSEPMLAHARLRDGALSAAGRAEIEWLESDAMIHRFEPRHDLVTSRFGVMFFADRERAFANLRRAVGPGGRFAFLTWQACADVEWMQAPVAWLAPLLPPAETTDGAIGPFAMAYKRETCALLEGAGFRQVEACAIDSTVIVGANLEDAVGLLRLAGPGAAALQAADPSVKRRAEDILRENLRRYATADGSVEMRAACWLYKGLA